MVGEDEAVLPISGLDRDQKLHRGAYTPAQSPLSVAESGWTNDAVRALGARGRLMAAELTTRDP